MYLFWTTYASTKILPQFLQDNFCQLSIKLSQYICLITVILQNKIKPKNPQNLKPKCLMYAKKRFETLKNSVKR